MKYLVSHQGQQIGPFTADEIVAQLRSRDLESLDYAFDEQRQDWVLLTEISEVVLRLKAGAKPRAPATTQASPEWFVLKGETKVGPFPFAEMVGLLQRKIVYPLDFCWHAGMDKWTRVSEVAHFKAAHVRELLAKDQTVFVARESGRAAFQAPVILHDHVRVWRGEARELSRGGLGLRTRTQILVPGQVINLHCGATEPLGAFNAICEIVAKTYVADGSTHEYGLRFLELSPDARAFIHAKVA